MSRFLLYVFGLSLCSLSIFGPGCAPESQCKQDTDCPSGQKCLPIKTGDNRLTRLCVPSNKLALGSVCKGDEDCISNICYSKSGFRYCSQPCGPTSPCSGGLQCESAGVNLKLCQLPGPGTVPKEGCQCGKEGSSCTKNGHSDCDTANGLFCLSSGSHDPKAICTKQCKPGVRPDEKGHCNEGYTCSKHATGLFLCVRPKFVPGELGKNCGQGGKAECKSEFFCYSRWPSDADAVCSKYCNPYKENDCGAGFVCESPREQDPWLCIPKGTKDIGGDCSNKLFLECKSGLCVKEKISDDASFCTQTCQPDKDTCPAGFRCRLFGHLYRYLCSRATNGGTGSLCTKNGPAACISRICISPGEGAINKICSQACEAGIPCPGGFVCDESKKYCVPKTGKKKIGEDCTSPQECTFGTCASDSQGKTFCTQRCTLNEQCPTGFECRNLEFTQRYCLPKRAGNRKLGEPCPNGPGDCEKGSCLSDPANAKTFCTQPCDDQQRLCPKPYKCTQLNKREAYCTPLGYQPP